MGCGKFGTRDDHLAGAAEKTPLIDTEKIPTRAFPSPSGGLERGFDAD
jgi:hypothetical protein